MKIPALNTFQSLAVVGVITSLLSQLGLYLVDKQVPNMIYLYPIWVLVFCLGSYIRYKHGGVSGGYHHHHEHPDAHSHDHSH